MLSNLLTHAFQGFASPPGVRFLTDSILPVLLQPPTRADWREETHALLDLRRVAKFHVELITGGQPLFSLIYHLLNFFFSSS